MRLAGAGALLGLGLMFPASARAECLAAFNVSVRVFENDSTSIEKARAVDDAADACVTEARAQLAEAARRLRKGRDEEARELALQADSILSRVADAEKDLGVSADDAQALIDVHGDGFREIRLDVDHPTNIDLPFPVRTIQRPEASVALASGSGNQLRILGRRPGVTTMTLGAPRARASGILVVIHVAPSPPPSPRDPLEEFPLFPSLETGIPGPGWQVVPNDDDSIMRL